MNEEVELLLSGLEARSDLSYPGVTLHRGQLDGLDVLLTVGGIGKVNAAMTTTYLIQAGADRVVFTGVAGAVHPELGVGDLVVSTDCVQHDVDVTPLGYELGVIPGETLAWPADEALRTAALEAARALTSEVNEAQPDRKLTVLEGRVASGDVFVAAREKVAWLWQTFGAACAEMEGAAVAQVCARHGVPYVVIRSVSDSADGSAQVDYREFMPRVARHAKQVVRGMTARLAQQEKGQQEGAAPVTPTPAPQTPKPQS